MIPRPVRYLAAFVAVIALAVWGAKWSARKDERTRAAIDAMNVARGDARAARADAERANAYAGRLMPLVSALTDSADKWKARAVTSQHMADVANRAFESAATVAPDTCAPVITAAREKITADGVTIGSLRNALGLAERARDTLIRLVTDSLRPAIASLVRADAKLDTAGKKLVAAVKPKWYAKLWQLRPKIGTGLGATYDLQDGRFHGGPTLFLGWTF